MNRLRAAARGGAIFVGLALAAMILPAAILATAGEPQSVLVLSWRPLDPARLPAGTTIIAWDGHIARLGAANAPAVRSLYSAGAILVLPMRAGSCISLRAVRPS